MNREQARTSYRTTLVYLGDSYVVLTARPETRTGDISEAEVYRIDDGLETFVGWLVDATKSFRREYVVAFMSLHTIRRVGLPVPATEIPQPVFAYT